MILLFFALSLLPTFGIYFLMRGLKKGDTQYRKLCRSALLAGVTSAVPVVFASLLLNIAEVFLMLVLGPNPVLKTVFHTFITLALAEEGVKCLTLFRFMKNKEYDYSWLDVICLMTLIGLGFGLLEDIPYAIGAGAGVMLVRGVLVMHGGYGFIMGYFMGRAGKTGKKGWAAVGFLLPWLLHGAYDCCLSDTLNAVNEDIGIISVLLAGGAFITAVVCIIFILRARRNALYTEPFLRQETSEGPGEDTGGLQSRESDPADNNKA